jgi:metallo-beta-lactamase family protein
MKITFYGAARTVTGSQHLIEVNGKRILLDCGLYQGRRAEAYERNKQLPFDPKTIDVMVLSHAHIDHSGNIPNLVNNGFEGDIVCTHATRDLCATMLLDSGHIQERDVEFVNKKRVRRGEMPVDPIYTQEDAKHSLNYFVGQGYDHPRTIAPGVTLTFIDAGHMLGSASVILDIEDHEAKRDVRLVFSADILIMESTYGDRLHPPYEDDSKHMERIIDETVKRGGVVLIPAFAVGRTQQLVLTLHQLALKGDIPDIPIYVDSPLAIDVTAVYRQHPECYDAEIEQFMREARLTDAFGFGRLTYTRTTEESKKLNFLQSPAVIIAASGMMEAGRILHHLKNHIEDPRTTVLVVGWQAENTLGRKLVDGEKQVRIFGEAYQNRAHLEVLNGFSGHADRDELLEWVGAIKQKPRKTFLVHGEEKPALALAESLKQRYGLAVEIPAWKQSFEV